MDINDIITLEVINDILNDCPSNDMSYEECNETEDCIHCWKKYLENKKEADRNE